MKNKEFVNDFIKIAKQVIKEVDNIDPDAENAGMNIAKAQMKNDAIKQANNTFRTALQHDIAKAKLPNYSSSFLEED